MTGFATHVMEQVKFIRNIQYHIYENYNLVMWLVSNLTEMIDFINIMNLVIEKSTIQGMCLFILLISSYSAKTKH